jgi:hypothetical protein
MMIRSVWAVFAGILVNVVLSLGTDQVLHVTGIYPPWGQRMADALFGVAFAYRVVYTMLGGYITARLAPQHRMKHVMVLAAIGLVLATAGVAVTWEHPELGPRWYPLALLITALPLTWWGGKLYPRRAG